MPLLLLMLALVVPRLIIFALYFFTDWFNGMFANIGWPLLGFLFLPMTLLWYSVVQQWLGGEWGLTAAVGLIITLVLDLFPARRRRALAATA